MAYKNKVEIMWIERFMMALIFVSIILALYASVDSGKRYYGEANRIEQEISKHYQIPLESVVGLSCYKGLLHYPDQGLFSGLLSFSPAISCNKDELKALAHNQYQTEFYLNMLALLFAVGFWLLGRKLKLGKQAVIRKGESSDISLR